MTTRAIDDCCRRTWTTAGDADEGGGAAGGGGTAGTPTMTQECGAILGVPGGWGGGGGGTRHTWKSRAPRGYRDD